jgi:hypothetical protein
MPTVARLSTRLTALRSAHPPFIQEPGLPCKDPDNDPDLWHSRNNIQLLQAQALCRTCPFVDDCADWALTTQQQHGVWGATTAKDRKQATRQVNA